MTTRHLFTAALAILSASAPAIAADPVVSNLTAANRPETKLVGTTCDVTADTHTAGVTMRIASDLGTNFNIWARILTEELGKVP